MATTDLLRVRERLTAITDTALDDFLKKIGIDNALTFGFMLKNRLLWDSYYEELPTGIDSPYLNLLARYYNEKVVTHKVHVFKEGLKLYAKLLEIYGAEFLRGFDYAVYIENLVAHDLSKFSVSEQAYCFYRFGEFNTDEAQNAFDAAWNNHKHRNPHHPEHYLSVNSKGGVTALPMPFKYIVEMFADWQGAGATYGTAFEDWIPKNIERFLFNPVTAEIVGDMLKRVYGFETYVIKGKVMLLSTVVDERLIIKAVDTGML